MWLRMSSCILALLLLLAPSLAAVCPDSCICTTTRDGLHRATCSSLAELYKFSLRQKHHNINILDLSHNNITKLSHELDRLTEVVTLDLSTNGIQNLHKFLHNAKKLVHLNLANNRIETLSFIHVPASVSSLDLSNNRLQNVPSDLEHLIGLEHLEMEGNPLDCTCDNILVRDRLLLGKVLIDPVICASPKELKGKSWLEIKTKDLCKVPKTKNIYLDMMMGDQPLDAVQVGQESTALKSMPLGASSDLDDGNVIQGKNVVDDDDSQQFLIVSRQSTSQPPNFFEGSGSGSGDGEITTASDYLIEPKKYPYLHADMMETDEIIPIDKEQTTDDPLDGSGEGSGSLSIDYAETTTETFVEITPGPIARIFENDDTNKSSSEFPEPEPPNLFSGGKNWNDDSVPSDPTEKINALITSSTPRDTTVSEQIRVTQASEVLSQLPATNESTVTPHKTGTYICIAVIVVLLVGLIGFAIGKGQMRKRRDRRLLRQQKRDVEKASKEMVDMNKSLLGKPALVEDPIERKVNGKYELVPTHEAHQKKEVNGEMSNGTSHNEPNGVRTDSPRDSNQNKSSSKDNNLKDADKQETLFDSAPASPDSLSSEEIFVPINNEPKQNGTADSDVSRPRMNGDHNTDSDFLSPSREYNPVYSPDMGRVRIKMAEIPKPKTPVLVTRSRSNAGDIIITPSEDAIRTTS